MKKNEAPRPDRRTSPWREIVEVVYAGLPDEMRRPDEPDEPERVEHPAPTPLR